MPPWLPISPLPAARPEQSLAAQLSVHWEQAPPAGWVLGATDQPPASAPSASGQAFGRAITTFDPLTAAHAPTSSCGTLSLDVSELRF